MCCTATGRSHQQFALIPCALLWQIFVDFSPQSPLPHQHCGFNQGASRCKEGCWTESFLAKGWVTTQNFDAFLVLHLLTNPNQLWSNTDFVLGHFRLATVNQALFWWIRVICLTIVTLTFYLPCEFSFFESSFGVTHWLCVRSLSPCNGIHGSLSMDFCTWLLQNWPSTRT